MIAPALFALAVQLMLGWLLADFLSGVLHWTEDRFGPGREGWPIIGPLVFAPNQLHHADPVAFTAQNFFDRNWTTWAAVAPIGVVTLWAFGSQPWIWSAIIGGMSANEVHAWAHRRSLAPAWAMPLQRIGLLQSPAHHAVHHVPPHAERYCVLTDWINPALEMIGFWQGLERIVPKRWLA